MTMAEGNSANIDTLDIKIQTSSDRAVVAITALQAALAGTVGALKTLTSVLNDQTKAATESTKETSKTATEVKKLSDNAKKASKGTNKFVASIGRIAMYRAIRTAIKDISSAIKEGLTNLYEYSKEVGTAFAPTVDTLRQHVLRLKNTFATALRPVLEALIPVVIQLVDWFTKLIDLIAQILSIMTGKVDENGRYTKAVLGDLQESNKEAKELRRTLLGFDEINRLDGDTNKGNASNAATQFIQADVSEEAQKIANALSKVNWKLIGTVLGAFLALNTAKFIGWKGMIGTFLLASAFFGNEIGDAIDKAIGKVDEFFNNIDLGNSSALNALKGTANEVTDFGLKAIASLTRGIYKLVHGDVPGALADFVDFLANTAKLITRGAAGVVNIILGFYNDAVNGIADIIRWIHNNIFAPFGDAVVRTWKNIGIVLHNFFADIQQVILTFAWVIVDVINGALKVIEIAVNGAIDIINFAFGKNINHVEIQIDTNTFKKEIDAIESTKLEPIDETVQFVARWEKEPERMKIQVDTSWADSAIDNWANKTKTKINSIMNSISAVTVKTENAAKMANSSKVYITQYASGGWVDAGTLMVAGEAGPEVVGNFNGRTGVMNDEQLAAALYNAVSAALANNPQGGDIYLDGEVIYRNTVRRNNNMVRSTGRSALLT